LIKDEHLDFNFDKKKSPPQKYQRVHQSQSFSGYNQKSILEIIVIVKKGRITWASLNIFLLIKARFQKMKSSPKRAVQTSPSITFYTHRMLNLISFLIILFVSVCCSCPDWGFVKGWICMKKLNRHLLQLGSYREY